MVLPIGKSKRVVGKFDQVRAPAHSLELSFGSQAIGERNLVDRNMARVELKDARIDKLMSRAEEILGHELGRNLVNSIGVEHTCSKNRFLGFNIVRQRAACRALQLRRLIAAINLVTIVPVWHDFALSSISPIL